MTAGSAGRVAARSIWLVGCGNMGGAMLRRWAGAGADHGLEPANFTVFDPGMPPVPAGVGLHASVPDSLPAPDMVVLAVKPQQIADAQAMLAGRIGDAMLVSILAGVDRAGLVGRFGMRPTVRAMPNLPVALGKGVVALHADALAEDDRANVGSLMAPLGLVEWIAQEALFDAVTALSGCGPGFVFRFIDALAAAGVALGLPQDQAARLALATVEGAGAMASVADASPSVLADRVASPGGSTREGLNVLDRDGALQRLMVETLAASARRNAELAANAR